MKQHEGSSPYPRWTGEIEPAPGDLRIVQAFVNTREILEGTDELEAPEGLAAWCAHWGLARGTTTEAERRQAVALREGLRQLLLANSGHETETEPLVGLDRALGDLPLRSRLHEDGTFELTGISAGWPQTAARLLTIVTRCMGEGTWRRLKACLRDECQWAYYDSSKNLSGKWCSMAGCGNVMKARAYRERLRDQGTS